MPLDDFEDLARGAPETVWLEFVRGRVEVKPRPAGMDGEILMSVLSHFTLEDRLWDAYPYTGLRTEASLAGRYLPDALFLPRDHRPGLSHWASPDDVSAVVEIVHRASGKDHRDHDAKRVGYASAAIPVHVLVDRDDNTITVFSKPKDGRYQLAASCPWGTTVQLPSPVDIALNTERLKRYTTAPTVRRHTTGAPWREGGEPTVTGSPA